MKGFKVGFYAMFVFVTLTIVGSIGFSIYGSLNTKEVVTITVDSKDRITFSDSEGYAQSKYLIYTENEVFENTDNLILATSKNLSKYERKRKRRICQ